MTALNVDPPPERVMRSLRRVAPDIVKGAAVIGIHPNDDVAGFCILRVRPRIGWVAHSGQGSPRDVAAEVKQRVGSKHAGLLAIEEPAFIGIGRQWMLAWTGGRLAGLLAGLLHDPEDEWMVTPGRWRQVIGFRQSTEGAKTDALAFARARGLPCIGPMGGDRVDEAMAIGFAFAAYRFCASVAGARTVPISPAEKGPENDDVRNGKDPVPPRRRQEGKETSEG